MHKLHDYFKIGTRVQVGIFYFIVTDTVETEKNYLIGLRQSLPEELQGRLVIKVLTTKTEDLISACEEADIDPQYRQRWIEIGLLILTKLSKMQRAKELELDGPTHVSKFGLAHISERCQQSRNLLLVGKDLLSNLRRKQATTIANLIIRYMPY